MGFTEKGLALINETSANGKYANIGFAYDPYCGNFGFTTEQVIEYIELILEWIKEHKGYKLIFQDLDEYNGRCWWLTDFE